MKLYHYSKQHYSELRTLEKQRPISQEEKKKALQETLIHHSPGFYYEHISFFFDPVPYDILGKIYGKDHRIWYSGNQIFQYEINLDALGKFAYEIVESPEKIKILYDETLSDDDYEVELNKLMVKHNYIGEGKKELIEASKHLIGTTRSSYLKVQSYPNWNEIKSKYAACVPHVMIYPDKGIVKYNAVKEVTIK